jgi:hypothetical protein
MKFKHKQYYIWSVSINSQPWKYIWQERTAIFNPFRRTSIEMVYVVCCICYSLLYLQPLMQRLWVPPLGSRPETEDCSAASPCCRAGSRSVAQCWRFASQFCSVAMWRQYTAPGGSIRQREFTVGEEMGLSRATTEGKIPDHSHL